MAISLKFDLPVIERLAIDKEKIALRIAKRLTPSVKKRVRKGTGADGKQMPKPKDAGKLETVPGRKNRRRVGKPMNRSRQLVKSIKARKTRNGARIEPTGKRSDGTDNFKVLAVNVHQRDVKMFGMTDAEFREGMKYADEELAKEIKRAKARPDRGFIAKVKKLR